MKFYIDGRCFCEKKWAGVARYGIEFVKKLCQQNSNYLIFIVSNKVVKHKERFPKNVKFIEIVSLRFIPGTFFILFLGFFIIKKSIFIGLSHTVPIRWSGKKYLCIHDFCFTIYPKSMTLMNKTFQRLSLLISLNTTKNLIFVSKYTMELFDLLYPNTSKKYRKQIISNTVSEAFLSKQESFDKKVNRAFDYTSEYILYVGSLEPRKNLNALIESFNKIIDNHDIQLILVGSKRWKVSSMYKRLNELHITDRVHIISDVCDQELRLLYSNCSLFVYPSWYEGFGIPPFEAYACSAKAVCSIHSEMKFYANKLGNIWSYNPNKDDLTEIIKHALKSHKSSTKMNLLPKMELPNFENE